MADSEVISLAIFTDTIFQGNEKLALTHINNYHRDLFPRLLERSRFNRRRRDLTVEIEAVRQLLTIALGVEEDRYRLMDSLPIELGEYVRGTRCRASRWGSRQSEINGLVSSPASERGSSSVRVYISPLLLVG
jgi:hypothetical protein